MDLEVINRELTREEARQLTNEIKRDMTRLWFRLVEAHDRKAYKALGYKTWEKYAKAEFGLSRAYSYNLLDQGKVVKAVESAAGMSDASDISVREALDLKRELPTVVERVRQEVADIPIEERAEIVRTVVTEERQRIVTEEPRRITQAILTALKKGDISGAADNIYKVWASKDWKKFSAKSWAVYCESELGASAFVDDHRTMLAQELSAYGDMSYRAIGDATGLDESTVRRDEQIRQNRGESETQYTVSAACQIASAGEVIWQVEADLKKVLDPNFYKLSDKDRNKLKRVLTMYLRKVEH